MIKRKKPSASATILDLSGCDLSPSSSSTTSEDNNTYFLNFFQQQCNNNGIEMSDIDTLNISKCRLGSVGVSNLFTFLLSSTAPSTEQDCCHELPMPMLKSIYLQRNAIGSAGGRAIGNFLSNCNTHRGLHIQVLDISLNDIKAGGGEPSAAKVISNALKDNTTLKQLIMEKCALGPAGAKDISEALIHNKTLAILDLAGNMIGPNGGEYLFNALRVNSSLQELGLRMNRIGGCFGQSDLTILSTALLSEVCSIQKLDLSYNDVKCSGCTILQSALAKSSTLIELILEKNDINEGGAIALANALGRNKSIEKLVLKGNDIYCAGGGDFGTALKSNVTLRTLDLSSCSIKNIGGGAIGQGLSQNSSLEHLYLDKNALGEESPHLDPTGFFSIGISMNQSLKTLSLSGNRIAESGNAEEWGKAIANAIANCVTLEYVDLSNNALSASSIVDAVASHQCIKYFDFSDNDLEFVSIETQLLLAKRMTSLENIDLSLNPLSSPPLGRLANYANLQNYLTLLSSEKTAISRIRLMVLGVGGVGKSTLCRAITTDHNSTDDFQSSLSLVQEWNVDRLADWASRLGTHWSDEAVRLVIDEHISGKDLPKLVDINGDDSGNFPPSQLLTNLGKKYPSIDVNAFTKAVSALLSKGYLSTVGVVKVDGTIELEKRKPPVKVELVDFAGQVEFLVSHQLLLSSMHTLCMIIQPAPSFGGGGKPDHRGSWNYWSQFLASLGDRRRGSLLLAVSQIDKLEGGVSMASTAGIMDEFLTIQKKVNAITRCGPLLLDYCPRNIMRTIDSIKSDISTSLDEVSHDWWVPSSYEALADILRSVAKQKASNNELPILTKNELLQEISAFCDQSSDSSLLLTKMKTDAQLLHRAINYLEAVGDVMQAGDELLIDPIGWFSNFLSHFIKDELAVSSIQVDSSTLRDQRGIVHLEDIVTALKHEYESPEEHIFEIMGLLCRLELCSQVIDSSPSASTSYLFPCLLPSLPITSPSELSNVMGEYSSTEPAIRGHRFRESSGFMPPGLFVGLLARFYQKLEKGTMYPSTMWKDHAVLVVNKTHVLVRCDIDHATIDVVGFAPDNEQLFVSAAKGQASIVIWMAHLIKMYLRNYSALSFVEAWLCPNPQCHGFFHDEKNVTYEYTGSEFMLSSTTKPSSGSHCCNVEGCYRFLGSGHSLEPMKLTSQVRICPYPAECSNVCQTCNEVPIFSLRESL